MVHHANKLHLWTLDGQRNKIRDAVTRCGLGPLIACTHRDLSNVLVFAFCERWHPEKNSFHLPFGEMTITLDDVGAILDIPVTSRTVSHQPLKLEQAKTF